MPWFAVDDGFDTHPKVRKAGNAAAGLFCRLGAFSARHSTDGRIDGVVARGYGTASQLAKLVSVGLLHNAPHECDPKRCPQPPEDGYALHDYLVYNRSRSQVEAAREAGRKRQQKGRDTQKSERTEPHPDLTRGSGETQVRSGWDSGEPQNESRFEDSTAGQDGSSRRDTLQGPTVVPSPPIPSPSVPPTEVQLASRDGAQQLPTIGPQPRIPANCQPLVDALTNNKMAVGWDLAAGDWLLIEALIVRCGIPMLVDHASGQWQSARSRPQRGSYFIPGWRSLPSAPAADATTLPAESGPMTKNQARRALFDQAAARLAGGMR